MRTDICDVYGFDVLVLCETWLSPNVPNRLLTVSGYRLYRSDRQDGRGLASGRGGVALLVRETHRVEVLPTPVTGVPNSNIEILWAKVFVGNHRGILFASVYRVPRNSAAQVTSDLEDIEGQVQHMVASHPGATLVLAGDLNCCLLKPAADSPGHRLTRLLTTYGLRIANTEHPTYRPANSLLDVIATSRPDLVTRAGVTRCQYGTPHDFTRLVLRCGGAGRPSRPTVQRRCLQKVDSEQFNLQLSEADWSPVLLRERPADKWEEFRTIFLSQLDGVAPVTRVRLSPPGAPPLTADTRQLLAERRQALQAGGQRDRYKELNRQCRGAIRRDQTAHYQRELDKAGPGSVWRVLRPIIGSKKETAVPSATPDALNDYYVSIGPATAASVPRPAAPVPVRLPRVTTSGFRPQPIDLDTLCLVLWSMKPSRATGLDGISVDMFRRYFWGTGQVLLDMINTSLVTCQVPAAWKHALVTPIPKGKGPSAPANTRPISILPGVMKITERVVQLQLTQYLETNKLLSSAQHGYRKGHSTETALSVITEHVLCAMDCREISVLVLLDLSKCFDVVPHARLLDKLALYGVDTEWFGDYLRGHTQQVQVIGGDGTPMCSAAKPNSIGVFQGGSLSCVLYTVFTNELSLFVPDGVRVVQYADDTQLLVSGKKSELPALIVRMEQALVSVYDWFCSNGMKLNASKTQALVLGTPAMLRGLPPVALDFLGTTIPDSRVVKNLGVIMDNYLSFQSHVDHVTSKCTGILLGMMHAKHVVPKSAVVAIVQALVTSIIRYCISVYGTCNATQLHRVQKLLNFGARVVSGRRKHDHVADVLRDLNWLDARGLVTYHRLCLTHAAITTGSPECIAMCIGPSRDHVYQTRGSSQRTLPRIHSESGRRRLSYGAVQQYNQLPFDTNTRHFKSTLRRYLLRELYG